MNSNTPNWVKEVQLYGEGLSYNHSINVVCPKCKGGWVPNQTGNVDTCMSVGRDDRGRVYAKCHRLQCGIGYRTSTLSGIQVPQIGDRERYQRPPNPYTHETIPFGRVLFPMEAIIDKYHLSHRTLDIIKWCPDRDEMVMPCYDINGCQWGVTTKAFKWFSSCDSVMSKAKHYNDIPTDHWIAFHSSDPSYMNRTKGIVMVEDWLSASRYCDIGIDSIAILGTNATPALLGLLANRYKFLLVSLDYDARVKAVSIRNKSELLFPLGSDTIILKDDPKDTPPDKLIEATARSRNDTGVRKES